MKKIFGNLLIVLSVLLVSLVAVPWNDVTQWSIPFTFLTDYEPYIKGGVGAFTIIVGIVYLILANNEYRNNGYVNRSTARTAFFPMYIFAIGITAYGTAINYYLYARNTDSTTQLLILGFFGVVLLNLIIFGHFFADHFRSESNGRRIAHFIFLLELVSLTGGITYWFYLYKVKPVYEDFNSFYFVIAAGVGILLYLVHLFITNVNSKKNQEIEALEEEIEDIVESKVGSEKPKELKKEEKKKRATGKSEVIKAHDGKKTMIVSNQQTIVSSESNIDPTNMIYEDVSVDPEFTKTSAPANQPNSIEYYIEKPKMFKPLDPTFDELVAYVRELPHVVTKLDDDRITFYIDRKPFLVLMNFGNYYRMAFKYDLEKGIRLIIKYPTISKNKSTRDELWFKANNYGDIPKEVIYQIVKYSYDNVNA